MPSRKPKYQARFESYAEIRMVARAAAKLKISMNRLVTEAAREVARTILADGKKPASGVISPSTQLTLNQ